MNARTVLWILSFVGFATNYMTRINLNIAIVSMVKPSRFGINQQNNATNVSDENDHQVRQYFDWDEHQQTQVLGAFYLLHWATELPGGLLAHHYGTKQVFGLSNLIPVLMCFVMPTASYFSHTLLVITRIIQGAIAGAAWPSMHTMVSKWVPPHERSKFVSAYLGSSVGTAVTYFICGFIIDYLSWEYVFYITGFIGLIWYVCWCFFVYETPAEHPWISKEEHSYITKSISDTYDSKKLPVPWMKIIRSGPLWITILCQWGCIWGLYTLMTHTPTYFKAVHKLDIKLIGLFSALPHLIRWIFSFIFAMFADYLIKEEIMSVTNVRKLASFICTIGVSLMLLLLIVFGENTLIAIIIMIVAVMLQGTVSTGPIASVIDTSPNFSGILQGLTGMISITAAYLSPVVVGILTENNQTIGQWNKVFLIASSILFVTGVIFTIFGSAKVAKWNFKQPAAANQPQQELKPLKHKQDNNAQQNA